mmetsp:Transcript_19108/g.34777  ORF Transcript_19108/g.34777 Transcript_19108/m.34777 type:complete len:385 (-) Transcript_19108:54-1208(-)
MSAWRALRQFSGKGKYHIQQELLNSKAANLKHVLSTASLNSPGVEGLPVIKGPDFNLGNDLNEIVDNYYSIGSQAHIFSKGVNEVNRMLNWRLSDEPVQPDDAIQDLEERKKVKATIYLGYASNATTSGLRDIIRYLAQHKLVDALFTTAGGIEEDFMKCFEDFYVGEFDMKGTDLADAGLCRTGNLLNTLDCYSKFYHWSTSVFGKMLAEQKQGAVWSPSSLINRFGKEINDERSIYYWCWKNDIPVFCPPIVDGALGENLLIFDLENPGLVLDLMPDVNRAYSVSMSSPKTGAVILGGGVSKHHILLTNIPKGGLDYAVYINTAQEYDSSDSGARPDEAVCWYKISKEAKPIKIHADCSFVFPLLVSKTFVPYHQKQSAGGH